MKSCFLALGALVLAYLLLGEVAWRVDFMAALRAYALGRPAAAVAEVLFFGLRVLLVVAGPPLAVTLAVRALERRLTKS
jgi:hypothetical protein